MTLGAGLVAVALRAGALPRAVPAVLVAIGAVQAGRALVTTGTLSGAALGAAPLVLAGVAVAGAASSPAVGWALPALVGLSGAGLLAAWAWAPAPTTVAAAVAQARADRLDAGALVSTSLPRSVAALRQVPRADDLGQAITAAHGVEVALAAGWVPGGALQTADRVRAARWLEEHGRGGEGRRLLDAGEPAPEARWLSLLLRRQEGLPDGAAPLGQPPESVPVMPGEVAVDWAFLANEERVLEVHAERSCALVVDARAEAFAGPPVLAVRVDAAPPAVHEVPEPGASLDVGELSPGPHRLRVAYGNDHSGEGGDRNAWVDGLRCVSSPARPLPGPPGEDPASRTPR